MPHSASSPVSTFFSPGLEGICCTCTRCIFRVGGSFKLRILCAHFLFTNICEVRMQLKRDIHVGKTILHNYMYQHITSTFSCVTFPNYLTWFVVCFPNDQIIYYTASILKKHLCATFFSARIHRNAMKRSIFLWAEKRHLSIVFSFNYEFRILDAT